MPKLVLANHGKAALHARSIKRRVPSPWLIIPVGIPGCGKTTLGHELALDNVAYPVQRDHLRSMFGEFSRAKERCAVDAMKAIVQGRLLNGENVYADCCNIDQYARAQYRDWCSELFMLARMRVRRMYVVIQCRPSLAIKRRSTGSGQVPESFILRQHAAFDPPTSKEHLGMIVLAKQSTVKSSTAVVAMMHSKLAKETFGDGL